LVAEAQRKHHIDVAPFPMKPREKELSDEWLARNDSNLVFEEWPAWPLGRYPNDDFGYITFEQFASLDFVEKEKALTRKIRQVELDKQVDEASSAEFYDEWIAGLRQALADLQAVRKRYRDEVYAGA